MLFLLVVVSSLAGCGTSDNDYQVALLGTWVSREVGQDDVIVETQTTLLPGGRVNWSGELRLPVPPTFYVPSGVSHEVKNGRLVFISMPAAPGLCATPICIPGWSRRRCRA